MTHSLDDALVEKIARAIHDARFEGIAPEYRPHPTRDYSDLEYATRLARATLEAAGVAELREENERLTCENRNLRQQLEPYLKGEETIREARQQMRDELAAERAERAALTNQGKARG